MSAADITELYRAKCPCGNGEYIIESVDHNKMYARAYLRKSVTCSPCRAEYQFHYSSHNGAYAEKKSELEYHSALYQEKNAIEHNIKKKSINPLLKKLENLARKEGRGSGSWFVVLSSILELTDISLFQNRVRSGLGRFLRDEIDTPEKALSITERLGDNDHWLADKIDRLKAIKMELSRPAKKTPLMKSGPQST